MAVRSNLVWLTLALSLFDPTCNAGPVRQREAVPDGFYAAPYYPTPYGGWEDSWKESYAKAQVLVDRMTLAEKTNITGGSGIFMGPCVGNSGSAYRVGFPQLCLQDGALGVGNTDHNTAFPAGITTGATFDKDLIYARAVAMGKEFRGKGAHVFLGPSVGPLGRKPLGGRNWEGFGSDPVLQGIAGALTIKGVQEQGVIATIKHFIGNEQEMYRMYNPFQPGYSSNIDDRTLHELYLWPFADGVHAGVGSAMTSYNAVNGSAGSQNAYMINNLLKDELGFQGFVMSDWLSHLSGVASALAGLDMSMPGDTQIPLFGGSPWKFHLTEAVLNGSVPVDRLNDMATRIVAAWYQFGQDKDFPAVNFHSYVSNEKGLLYPGAVPASPIGKVNWFVDVQADHASVARQIAQDAITLLKNDDDFLPLSTKSPLKVFGSDARVDPAGANSCGSRACNKGTLGMGWGSGVANYPYFDDPITAIKKRLEDVKLYDSDNFPLILTPSPTDDDVAIVFINSDAGENSFTVEGNHGDRDNDKFSAWHNGDKLVQKAAEKYRNVVVVVHTVGPLIVEPWIDLPSIKTVLFAHLPGQEAGESLANVLFGDVSPSGHLPYSITKKEDDLPDSVSKLVKEIIGQPQDTYSEGLYIDYRWLNKQKIKPRYAFGHGLSYTTFNYTDAHIKLVNTLSSALPTARQPKPSVPVLSTEIPPASEAYEPAGFTKVWRYIYSWLSKSDADKAYAVGVSSTKSGSKTYPYPEGYSAVQKPGVPAGGGQGGNPALFDTNFEVDVTVQNTGSTHKGKASVQAYVQFPADSGYDTPIIQLRDFAKTKQLAAGESETVTLRLRRKDLSVWDTQKQNWVAPGAEGDNGKSKRYTVWVGEGSDKLFTRCFSDTLVCERGVESPV
ncbi:glycosyl hydrolase family 3 N terminal domain-containing protein [Pseudoneurospora amorphoporcata]|uniref:beta-glucosidase n=1 Tax=Pseudoneurospora amorphoporcata TaxID=241081 RepID=A0AAN6SKA6_9PEZI|nr:glycosyl hydrolase family 3 N terminal domain-containing protein [Pseudoneurospora amorphoporcata]